MIYIGSLKPVYPQILKKGMNELIYKTEIELQM